jgi:hypothetical protein
MFKKFWNKKRPSTILENSILSKSKKNIYSKNPNTISKKKILPRILEVSREDDDDEESKEEMLDKLMTLNSRHSIGALSRRQNSIGSLLSRENSIGDFRRSDLSNLSLQSSNKSDEDYIIPEPPEPESHSIYELLKKLNKLALEQQDNDLHTKSLNKSLLLLDKMEKIEKHIDDYLSDLEFINTEIINTDINSDYVQNLFTNIRLREKTSEYEEEYKIYKNNLNQVLTELVMILKHVKSNLTAIYIKQYKLELIENINDSIKKIKYILSELFAYYNENLPFYRKKWWGGKTRKNRKWSNKYKKSINCGAPKGFSQKQYCKSKTKKLR